MIVPTFAFEVLLKRSPIKLSVQMSPLVLKQTKTQKVDAAWSAASTFWALYPDILSDSYTRQSKIFMVK